MDHAVGDSRPSQANMVMAVECMAGTPDVGLVKLEQNAIVGEYGAESILKLPSLITASKRPTHSNIKSSDIL